MLKILYFLEIRNRIFLLVLLLGLLLFKLVMLYKETLLIFIINQTFYYIKKSFASFYFIFTDVTEVFIFIY
jgi:hypothetical protein